MILRSGLAFLPHIIKRAITWVVNTHRATTPADSYYSRRAALECNIPYTTTLAAARAMLDAIRAMKKGKLEVKSLQEYHAMVIKAVAQLRAVKG